MNFIIFSLLLIPSICFSQMIPDEELLSTQLLDEIEKGKKSFDVNGENYDALRLLEAMEESEHTTRPPEVSENPYKKRVDPNLLKKIHALGNAKTKAVNGKKREAYLDARRFKDYKYFLDLEDVVKSPIFKATLRKGTSLYSIPNLERFTLPKDLYVWAHSKSDSEKYIYVLNREYRITYKVLRHQVINIEAIANLDVPPDKYEEVDYSDKMIPQYNGDLKYSTSIFLNTDYVASDFTSDVANNPSANKGQSLRFSALALYKFNTPFSLGLKADYDNASFTGASKTTLSIGPGFRWKVLEEGKKRYHLGVYFQTSLSSKISVNGNVLNLNSSIVEVTLSQSSPNKWGQFIWGATARKNWQRVKSNQISLSLADTNSVDNSLGAFVGQEF